jgi:hypothetical protein
MSVEGGERAVFSLCENGDDSLRSQSLEGRLVGRGGRPKLKDGERRTAGQLVVRLNERERETVTRKAEEAGVTPTEWARYAALGRTPPPRRVIPELNRKAWLELSKLAATLNGAIWRFRPGGEDSLLANVERVRRELAEVRNMLIGGEE